MCILVYKARIFSNTYAHQVQYFIYRADICLDYKKKVEIIEIAVTNIRCAIKKLMDWLKKFI